MKRSLKLDNRGLISICSFSLFINVLFGMVGEKKMSVQLNDHLINYLTLFFFFKKRKSNLTRHDTTSFAFKNLFTFGGIKTCPVFYLISLPTK